MYVLVFGMSLHSVHEGYVGVYWRGGALLPTVTKPGLHAQIPVITTFSEVQVTVQTDAVSSIPCGTSGGTMISFDKVEVVNRLRSDLVYATIKNYTVNYDKTWIFDKIHHEINQFCSSHTLQEVYITLFDTLDEHLANVLQANCDTWAPGIEIIAVRVTKPRIPDQIKRNFEQMEAEKTKLLIANEAQRVAEKEAETERKKATVEAQKNADVAKIQMAKELMEGEAKQKISAIEDQIHSNRERAYSDAVFYKMSKEAESNQALLTSEYLEYMHILALSNNTKVYFGEKMPNLFIDKTEH
eukprot:CAMPEP_0119465658 /NCGR_PEP_ID=MMETSP1344-20130328/682_1 /TAXON_ID=236787 /ORGANISM="Florenciella parvula, Strain CCMP2471" /LENGTH=298 /DNA_ID=CAMNT_0007497933 /DNA_START=179 /DNA_END=1075 /DNA_ORIENTATION=-